MRDITQEITKLKQFLKPHVTTRAAITVLKFLDSLPLCKVGGKQNEFLLKCGGRLLVSLLNINVYKLLRILLDSRLNNQPYRVRAENEWITVP